MTAVGTDTTLLFCEGVPRSLDARLLNHVLSGQTGKLIVPAHGKQGFRAFIAGYLESYHPVPPYFGFRDRDFDARPPDLAALIRLPGNRPIFLSYRACIESYLLDPALIEAYWSENHRQGPAWQYGPSPRADQIETWIRDAAESITHYQAARWALARIKPSDRWPEVPTTWTDGSGDLPSSLEKESCLNHAKSLVREYITQSNLVPEKLLEQRYEEYVNKFAAEAFWSRSEYSVWFHGKDLQKAMGRLRPSWLSLTAFCSWAVDRIDLIRYPDLMELKAKVAG